MSNRAYYLPLMLLLILGLTACSTTGGVLPFTGLPLPKILRGKIENNIYIAADRGFSVAVPHAQDSYEYRYMSIKEEGN